jgi:hypothetical protein
VFNNLLPTFETSPKIEFNSISVARWLIRLPPSGGFFRKKFYRKKLRFRFFSSKIRKKLRFSIFYPQYFSYRLWLIFCTGGSNWLIFCTGGFLATANTNTKEFFNFDLCKVPFWLKFIFSLKRTATFLTTFFKNSPKIDFKSDFFERPHFG